MSTPSVPDFIAGYAPQQADFESWWVGPATFFLDKVVARVTQQSTTTSLPDSAALTKIKFDTVDEDPYSGWNGTTFEWQAPAGYSGWYLVTFRCSVTGAADNVALALQLATTYNTDGYLDTVVEQPVPAGASPACSSQYVFLAGGQDSVWAEAAIVNSSSALSTVTTTGLYPTMEICWVLS